MRNECQKDATLIRHSEGPKQQSDACEATPARSTNIEERRNKKMQRKARVERVRETSSSPERAPCVIATTVPFILLDPQKVSKMSIGAAAAASLSIRNDQSASNHSDQKPD